MPLINKHKPDTFITSILEHIIEEESPKIKKVVAKRSLTKEVFLERPIPPFDIKVNSSGVTLDPKYFQTLDPLALTLGAVNCSASHYLPPNSQLPWHTNSDTAGKRLYYTYGDGSGIFRYKDYNTDKIHEDYDEQGWTVREFYIPSDQLFWHTVYAGTGRHTFGFRF